jgi:AcrR family transcriptional regulator
MIETAVGRIHMPENDLSQQETRRRLLEAAGEIFSQRGFKDATVRDICAKAGANIAAVNYHFGDKQGLYSETLRYWVGQAMEKYPPNLGVQPGSSPEEKLEAFIRSFLLRILDTGRPSWYGKLIAREMVEPTPALDERVKETLGPMLQLLLEIIRELIGPDATDAQLRHAAASVVGQIVFYHHCRPALDRMFPGQTYDREEIERLAKHITIFTLAGLRAMRSAPRG